MCRKVTRLFYFRLQWEKRERARPMSHLLVPGFRKTEILSGEAVNDGRWRAGMSDISSGSCLCGAVRFQTRGPWGPRSTTGRYRTPCALLFLRPPRRAPEGTPPPRALGSGQAPAPSIIWPLPRRCAKQSRDAWSQLRMNASMISGFQPLNQSACSEYPAGMRLS